ncbi:hypothetical protein [Curtobacterium sp. MCBA15_001]|uniref:hypothetical protein n=1 Tax=Curtobacterium sp. MCBA15_001 TaxID=1898731 RepID=UPI0008DE6E5E|nr:hypothetical protein [Curtobacterium sp. MCBA15_001]OIH92428.1 hypothetical protein BIU90_11090 [Curtobacterium sp. MCBA15_001]
MTETAPHDVRQFQADARTEIRHLTGEEAHRARQEHIAADMVLAPLGTITALPLLAPILTAVRRCLSELRERWLQ